MSEEQGGKVSTRSSLAQTPFSNHRDSQNQLQPISRFWRLQGETPVPNQDTIDLAKSVQQLPSTYERVRWSPVQITNLKEGVISEVRCYIARMMVPQHFIHSLICCFLTGQALAHLSSNDNMWWPSSSCWSPFWLGGMAGSRVWSHKGL